MSQKALVQKKMIVNNFPDFFLGILIARYHKKAREKAQENRGTPKALVRHS